MFKALIWASQTVLVAKNPPANAGEVRDSDSVPGLGRSPGEGNGSPLLYSCLENPMDRGARQATVHWITELKLTEFEVLVGHPCRKGCTELSQDAR